MELIDKNKIINSGLSKGFVRWDEIKYDEPILTIPENPTNGDMIKAMFPSCKELEILGDGSISCIAVEIGMGTSYFSNHWWNSPYKKEV